jgi:hypothetical protein
MRPGLDADHSPQSSAEEKNDLPPSASTACTRDNFKLFYIAVTTVR